MAFDSSGVGGGGAAGAEARAAAAGARVPRGELPALSARRVESAASRARGGEAIVSNVAEVKASVERGIRLWFVPTEAAHNDIGLVGDVSRLITLEHPGDSFPDFVISAVNTSFAEMTRLARERGLFRFDPTSSQWVANPSAFNAEQADFFLRQYFELVKAILVGARGFLLETAASDLDKSLGIQYKLKTWLADVLKESRGGAAYNADVEALGRELYLSWEKGGLAFAAGAQNLVELQNPGIKFSEISELSQAQAIALGEHFLASRMVGSFIKSRGMLITFFQNVGLDKEALTIHGLFSGIGGALSPFDLAAADADFEAMLAYDRVKGVLKANPFIVSVFGDDVPATFSAQFAIAVLPSAATPLYSLFAELWKVVEAMPSSDAVQTGVKTGLFNQILHVFDKVKAVGLEGSLSECKLLISSVLGHVADEAQHAKIFAAVRKVDVLESALSAFTDRRGIYQAVSKLKLSAVRSTIEAGDFERAFALDKGESFPGFVVSGVDVIFGEMQTLVAGAVDRIKSSLPDNWLELQEPVVAASMMDPLSVDQAYELSGKVFELQRGLLVGARRLFLGSVADHPRETCSVELAGNLGIACRLQSWFVDALKIQIGVEAYKRTMTERGREAYAEYQSASNAIKARYQERYPEIKFDYFSSLPADAPELASLFIEFGEHQCASFAIRGLLKAKETLGMFYSSNEMGVDARLFDQVLFPKINPLFPIDLATSDPRFDSDVTLIGHHIRDKAVPALSNFFQPPDSVTPDIKAAIVGALGTTFNPSAFVFPFELRSLFQGLWAEVKLLPDSKVRSDFFNRIIALSEVMRKKEGAFEAQFVSQARDLLLLMLRSDMSVDQVSRVVRLLDGYSSALFSRIVAGDTTVAELGSLFQELWAEVKLLPDAEVQRDFFSRILALSEVMRKKESAFEAQFVSQARDLLLLMLNNAQLAWQVSRFIGLLDNFFRSLIPDILSTLQVNSDDYKLVVNAFSKYRPVSYREFLADTRRNLCAVMSARIAAKKKSAESAFSFNEELFGRLLDFEHVSKAPPNFIIGIMKRQFDEIERLTRERGFGFEELRQWSKLSSELNALQMNPAANREKISDLSRRVSTFEYSSARDLVFIDKLFEMERLLFETSRKFLLQPVSANRFGISLGLQSWVKDYLIEQLGGKNEYRNVMIAQGKRFDTPECKNGYSSLKFEGSAFTDDDYFMLGEHLCASKLVCGLTMSREVVKQFYLLTGVNQFVAVLSQAYSARIGREYEKVDLAASDEVFSSEFDRVAGIFKGKTVEGESLQSIWNTSMPLVNVVDTSLDPSSVPLMLKNLWDEVSGFSDDVRIFCYNKIIHLSELYRNRKEPAKYSSTDFSQECSNLMILMLQNAKNLEQFSRIFSQYVTAFKDSASLVHQEMSKPGARAAYHAILNYASQYEELPRFTRRNTSVWGRERPVGELIAELRAAYPKVAPAASGLAEVGVSESKNDGVVAIAGGGAAAGTGVLASGDVAAVAPAEGSAVAAAVPKVTSPAISVNLNASLSDEAIKMKPSGFAFDSKDYPMATFARDVNGGQYRIAGRDIAELYQERYRIRPGDPGDDFGTRFPELIRHHLKLGLEVPVYSSTPQDLLGCIMDPAGIFGKSFLPTDAHPVEGPLMGAKFYGVRQEVRANLISVGGAYQVEVVAKLQGLETPPQGASGERAILPLDATVKYRAYAGVDGVYKIIPDSVVVSGPDAVVVQEALLQTQLSDEVQRKLLLRCFLPGFTASTAAELQSYFTGRIANAKTVKDVQALLDLFLTQSTIKGSLIQRLLGDNTKVYSVIVQGCVDRASSLVSTTKTVASGKARYGVKKTGVATASSDADREIFAQIKSRATSSLSRVRGRKQDSEMVGLRRWVSAVKRFIKVAYGSVLDRPAQNVGLWFDGCFRCFGGVRRAPPVGFRPNNVHVPDGSPSSPSPIAVGTATAVAPAALSGDKAVIGVPGVEPKASTAPAGHDL